MSVAPAVVVRCLGGFSVVTHDGPVTRWSAGKARGLFQYLVIHRERPVLRDRLHEVLWPGGPWSPRSSSLKVAVHALRQVLESPAGAPRVEVRLSEYGYLLHADDIWVDLEDFEATVDAADALDAHDHEGALRLYRRAADLYGGDFLDGEAADWVIERREWARSKALRALTALRDDAYRRQEPAQVIEWCRRILRIDPYQEATYRALMLTHGRLGELGLVRSWHEMCVRRLREDLAVEPEPDTHQVFDRVMGNAGGSRSPRPRPRSIVAPLTAVASA
jgi:two-component SAPR family response regulator